MTCTVDWNSVCLVCLQKGEHFCIFQKDEDTGLSVADKIMKCSSFSVKEGTDHPDNICVQCLEDLNVAYKFRQNCDQSNSIIKAILSNDHRELEVSGLRIKIPFGLKVKVASQANSPESTLDEIPVTENVIKHEDDELKVSDECENFDAADYFDNADVSEDEAEKEDSVPFDNDFEVMEKLELISELDESKQVKIRKVKKKPSVETKKRGRGRPKKSFGNGQSTYKITDESLEALIQDRPKKSDGKPQKICEICGNSYKYQHALNSHMRRHRNERPFNCEFCDKAFVSAVELRRHMRVHTGQKPYECQYCVRRFSDYGSRIKHERTHTGERPYACATCGKTFAYAHVLTVHMRTHTGEKKYICSECGRGFTKKAYLDNHMTHHNIDEACEDTFETSAATATISRQYEQKMQIDRYEEIPTNGDLKPKEENADELEIQDEFQAIGHVSVP